MIDREKVAALLYGGGVPPESGQELLERLEAAGYRVVRAGMVPDFAPLDSVQRRFRQLPAGAGCIDHSLARTVSDAVLAASAQSMVILGIDPSDVDPEPAAPKEKPDG